MDCTIDNDILTFLSDSDERLQKVISAIGPIPIRTTGDPFSFIVKGIVGQMISSSVKKVLLNRLYELCDGVITPNVVKNLSFDSLRSIGISNAKTSYILSFADLCDSGAFDFSELDNLDDDMVLKRLTSIRGVGTWTAKMFLLFYLQREDIVPYEDGAFIQGYKWLYENDKPSKEDVLRTAQKWHPYSSYAARYLYISLDSGLTKRDISEFLKA